MIEHASYCINHGKTFLLHQKRFILKPLWLILILVSVETVLWKELKTTHNNLFHSDLSVHFSKLNQLGSPNPNLSSKLPDILLLFFWLWRRMSHPAGCFRDFRGLRCSSQNTSTFTFVHIARSYKKCTLIPNRSTFRIRLTVSYS